ncbi:unnamed protein product, partial [Ilex paraguariensis]
REARGRRIAVRATAGADGKAGRAAARRGAAPSRSVPVPFLRQHTGLDSGRCGGPGADGCRPRPQTALAFQAALDREGPGAVPLQYDVAEGHRCPARPVAACVCRGAGDPDDVSPGHRPQGGRHCPARCPSETRSTRSQCLDSPMKVLLVILHADPSRGGAEAYTIQLLNKLREMGHEARIAASTFHPTIPAEWRVPLKHEGLTRTSRYACFLDALDEHLDATSYDRIHAMLPVRRCDLYHPHAGVAAILPAGVSRFFNPRPRRFAAIERALLEGDRSPVVLSLSSYIDAQLKKAYPATPLRIERLMNAADLGRFDPERVSAVELPIAAPRALMIAQDFARKGLSPTLRAMQAVEAVSLVVVGGDDPAPYRKQSEPFASRVHFAGLTSEAPRYYRAADFFVLPTRHDPCSLVVLEALAMGLPVITTRQNGAADVMTHGVHGFILDHADDPPALAEALRSLADDST